MIQTGLITGDTWGNLRSLPSRCFGNKIRIRQKRAGHADHICTTVGKDRLCHVRHVDSIRGDDRDIHFAHQLLSDPSKGTTRNRGSDGRDAGLMPANARVQDRGTSCLNRFGQLDNLIPSGTTRNQINHGQTVDNDKLKTNCFANPAHNLDWQTHAVLI